MKKLPNGISNYEELIRDNCIYVDKTMYFEKLENLTDKRIMFLRPRKFGKTLFTSTLENYYDVLKENKFEKLFGNTYIGKNPTKNKNSYHILKFNFSGIDSSSIESTIKSFKNSVMRSIERFVKIYKIDFFVNENQEAEEMLDSVFIAFETQKIDEKIYVIIDEYDHFANELLGFRTDNFKNLLSRNGKIRKWYEILKKGTESVVDRIFITGVAPITLDSTTSGFNIASNITKDVEFNEMLGFSKEDVKYIMRELEINEKIQNELLPIIKQNYDGYIFSNSIKDNIEEYRMYNSNMTLYFLNLYNRYKEIPKELIDVNIISDYKKIEGLINLYKNNDKEEILQKIVKEDYIVSELTEKFNSEVSFGRKEIVSLLFYLGYLTIKEIDSGVTKLGSPNDVMKKVYSENLIEFLQEETAMTEEINKAEIKLELIKEGKIDKAIGILGKLLTNLSNRDYQKFDEKYVKVIFYAMFKMIDGMYVKSELEIGGKYADLVIRPIDLRKENYGVLIEFKYIKKEDYEKDETLLEQKLKEAKEQIEIYKNTEEINLMPNVRSYAVVAIKDKIIVEEV